MVKVLDCKDIDFLTILIEKVHSVPLGEILKNGVRAKELESTYLELVSSILEFYIEVCGNEALRIVFLK